MSTKTNQTIRLTMNQALVKFLQVQYSERDGKKRRLIPAIFGIFGHGNVNSVSQALQQYGDDLPFYQPCNEQSMVHSAIAFARANSRLSTLACTTSIGPGATNMITGAATATIDRVPVLLLPSDYFANRYQGPVLQQLEYTMAGDVSVNDCFRPVSRFFDRMTRPEQLLTALPSAMRVLTDPVETGAVTIALSQDIGVTAYEYPVSFFKERIWRVERPIPDPQRIAEAVELIKNSKRPLIYAGGGVLYSEAFDELLAFAKTFNLPVCETYGGKGALQKKYRLALGGGGSGGNMAAAKITKQADLIICIGSRLNDFATGSRTAFQNPDVKFIHVNVCGYDAYKLGALPVIADAREGLRALAAACKTADFQVGQEYVSEVEAVIAEWEDVKREQIYVQHPGELMSQGQLIGILNEEAGEGDVIVTDAGTPPGDLQKLWDVTGGCHCTIEMGNSCMAYGIPAGIGLRLAQPQGEVYVLVGDGTYLMNPMELVTALQEKMKMTVVLVENHGYQSIHVLQMDTVGHPLGTEFLERNTKSNRLDGEYIKIDLAKNAESMGARTWNVATPEELRAALREARDETRTCVIVAEVEPHRYVPGSGIYWEVPPVEIAGDKETMQLRSQYNEIIQEQRFYY